MFSKRFFVPAIAALAFLLLSGCAAKKADEEIETRSMAQIHEEEGIPVTVVHVKKEFFASSLKYNATVTGISESSATSSVSDTVEEILYSVGDYVEKDQVVVKFPLTNPVASYYQAKAAYDNALETYKRIEKLFESKGVSRQDYDNAKTALDVAQANWDNVNKMLNVRAPISAYITRLDVSETENVESGDPLFTVANYDRLKAKIWVSEKDIAKFRNDLRAEASWGGNTVKGRVARTDLALNPERQAFGAIVEFENTDHRIKSGISAEITVFVYENPSAVVVDRKYIAENRDEKYVFVASNDTAVKRSIVIGERDGQKTEVLQGLNTGDILVAEGSAMLTDSSRIRIVSGE